MNENILILGAGHLGQAIGQILSGKGSAPDFWDKQPGKVDDQKDLSNLVSQASIIFLAVPSWSFREALGEIKEGLSPQTVLIGLSKGLEQDSGLRIDQITAAVFPEHSFVLLSGPMLASDLMAGKKGFAVLAGKEADTRPVAALFAETRLSVILSPELPSVALAGVLKNVYALGLGLLDGLEAGMNVRGWALQQALLEMQSIAEYLDLDAEVMMGPAGLGDLVTTGFSQHSQNYRVGWTIAEGGQVERPSEGWISFAPLARLLGERGATLPLFAALTAMLLRHADPKESIAELF